jgi:E3 ubiquitin-protein ligase MARCH6
MKPTRLLFLLHVPIRIVRLLTDPIVDAILWFIRPAASHVYRVITEVLKLRAAESATTHVNIDVFYQHALRRLEQLASSLTSVLSIEAFKLPTFLTASRSALIDRLDPLFTFLSIPSHTSMAKIIASPYLLQNASLWITTNWRRLAEQNGDDERVFAVLLGYLAIGLALGVLVASGAILNGTSRFVRSFVAQQVIVVKVCWNFDYSFPKADLNLNGCPGRVFHIDGASSLSFRMRRPLGHFYPPPLPWCHIAHPIIVLRREPYKRPVLSLDARHNV